MKWRRRFKGVAPILSFAPLYSPYMGHLVDQQQLRLLEAIAKKQRVTPETVGAPAKAVVNILGQIESIVHQADSRNEPVVLLHFPRGASPIVNGLKNAWDRLYHPQPLPFLRINMPVSRENLSDDFVDRVIEKRLAEIAPGTHVIYVDEALSGAYALANLTVLQRILHKKKARLYGMLVVSSEGTHLDPHVMRKMSQLRRFKGVQVTEYRVPELLPWTDQTRFLGMNWGLDHIFPTKLIQNACGTGAKQAQAIDSFAKAFYRIYYAKSRRKPPEFKRIRFPSNEFIHGYEIRDKWAIEAFREAAEASGFSKLVPFSIRGHALNVNGKTIDIPLLRRHLLDNHPRFERKAVYQHHLAPDAYTLIDFGHRPRTFGRRFVSRLLAHGISDPFARLGEAQNFQTLFQHAIGTAVNEHILDQHRSTRSRKRPGH